MIVCGVELKSNEAIVCLLTYADSVFTVPDCRATRIALVGDASAASLRHFQATFAKLMEDYKVDQVVIRERLQKGKFAGSAQGFKLEAAIQLLDGQVFSTGTELRVELLSPSAIKSALALYPMPVRFADTELKAFQEPAFTTAYAYLVAEEDQ
jgi:hypothetical protein